MAAKFTEHVWLRLHTCDIPGAGDVRDARRGTGIQILAPPMRLTGIRKPRGALASARTRRHRAQERSFGALIASPIPDASGHAVLRRGNEALSGMGRRATLERGTAAGPSPVHSPVLPEPSPKDPTQASPVPHTASCHHETTRRCFAVGADARAPLLPGAVRPLTRARELPAGACDGGRTEPGARGSGRLQHGPERPTSRAAAYLGDDLRVGQAGHVGQVA